MSSEAFNAYVKRLRYISSAFFFGYGSVCILNSVALPLYIPAPGAEAMAPTLLGAGILGIVLGGVFYYLFTKRLMKADGSDSKSGTSDKIQP